MQTIWIKRITSVILLGLLIYFFLPMLKEAKSAVNLFRNADWVWFGVLVLLQGVSYMFLSWLNCLALRPFSGRIGFWPLTAVLTAMAFIQVAIPSMGASGMALRVRYLGRYGYKPEESLFSLAVETIAEIIALISLGIVGVVYLLEQQLLTTGNIFLVATASLASTIGVWLAWRLIKSPEKSHKALLIILPIWNRVLGRYKHLEVAAAVSRLDSFHERLVFYRQVSVWKFAVASYGKVVLDVLSMGAGFYLVGYGIDIGRLFLGYGLVLTLSGLAALPGGLGMTDAYVTVIFSWVGVPVSVALAAGLIYRLVAYWAVRFIGYLSWQFLESRPVYQPHSEQNH